MIDTPHPSSVSALRAMRRGAQVLCHHASLLAITGFAVVCERAFSLYMAWTGISSKEYLGRYRGLLDDMAAHPLAPVEDWQPLLELFALCGVIGGLLALGGFVMTGLLGLLRDLLIREGYEAKALLPAAKRYFWTSLRFKLPLYFALGLVACALLPLAEPLLKQPERAWSGRGAALVLLAAFPFFLGRIFLSLGPKCIVARDARRVLPLYRQIWGLVRPWFGQVAMYYGCLIVVGGLVATLPVALAAFGAGQWWITSLMLLASAALAVWAKASAFTLFLELAGTRSTQPTVAQPEPATLTDNPLQLTAAAAAEPAAIHSP